MCHGLEVGVFAGRTHIQTRACVTIIGGAEQRRTRQVRHWRQNDDWSLRSSERKQARKLWPERTRAAAAMVQVVYSRNTHETPTNGDGPVTTYYMQA
jgi:hypothetical protein